MTHPVLRYIGNGAWLHHVPSRDLFAHEITQLGLDVEALVKSGLYEHVRGAKAVPGAPENKLAAAPPENKE